MGFNSGFKGLIILPVDRSGSMEMVITGSFIGECVKLIECSWPVLGFYPVICLCGLRKTTTHFSHYSRSRVRDSNPVSL